MVTKNIKYFLMAGLVSCGVTAALTSCSDMLETDSELVEFADDNTLNHPTDSVYSALGILNAMQKIADRTVLLGEVRGDLVTPTNEASADLKRLSAFDFSQQNKYNQVSDYYAVINNCNYYLAHVDTVMERRGRKLFEYEYAAVKAYRAWTYLQLAQAYGKVPLVTTPVMTEQQARDAMNQPYKTIAEVCNYFVADLTPYAFTEKPDFREISGWISRRNFFIPMRALLGDLCLWAGRYEDAARWYNSFLNDEKEPVMLNAMATATWGTISEFQYPRNAYGSKFSLSSTNEEMLSLIPMEAIVFNGTVSDLRNVFCSTEENKYFAQMVPSKGMYRLSAAQDYCIEYKTDARTDTIYVPKVGLLDDIYRGDLRFSSVYSESSRGAQNAYSEYSAMRHSNVKFSSTAVATYRRTMVYLRYAEALNRAGLPQSAFLILKHGICPDNISLYVDSVERAKAGTLIDFDSDVFARVDNTGNVQIIGVHSYGSGDTQVNGHYELPQPADSLATRQDTVNYQIPLVEDMIITEMALEGAFEGNRYYDLMRVALRRGDAAYLADPVSRRNSQRTEEPDAALRAKLMDEKNWYLPLP